MSARDCVDRTGVAAMQATDARGFVDNGDRGFNVLGEWNNVPAEQLREPTHGFVATRRAKIHGRFSGDDGSRVGPAARVTALCALGLRQHFIDLLHKVRVAGRQSARRIAQSDAGEQGDNGDCHYGCQHS
jgi:hypothetical protein